MRTQFTVRLRNHPFNSFSFFLKKIYTVKSWLMVLIFNKIKRIKIDMLPFSPHFLFKNILNLTHLQWRHKNDIFFLAKKNQQKKSWWPAQKNKECREYIFFHLHFIASFFRAKIVFRICTKLSVNDQLNNYERHTEKSAKNFPFFFLILSRR